MKAIEVQDVTFQYHSQDKIVLNHVSFQVEQGEYVALIGHNGSGKSTLAKLLLGLLEAKEGKIFIFEEELTDQSIRQLRQKIGIVFQNPDNQFIGATVRDDIAFGLENHCVPHSEMDAIIQDFSSQVGMSEFLDKEPTSLSGGQKQRVAIAGVLAMHPEIIVFDEATAMLDPKGKKEIRDLVSEMRKKNPQLTIISITHDIEEAANADRVIILNSGEIYQVGTPQEIFQMGNSLKEIHLDSPFLFQLQDALEQEGVSLWNVQDEEKAVKELCQ